MIGATAMKRSRSSQQKPIPNLSNARRVLRFPPPHKKLTLVLVQTATDLRVRVVQRTDLLQNGGQHFGALVVVVAVLRRVRAAMRRCRRTVAAVLRVVRGAGQARIAEAGAETLITYRFCVGEPHSTTTTNEHSLSVLQPIENVLRIDAQILAAIHHIDGRRQTGEVRVHVALAAAVHHVIGVAQAVMRRTGSVQRDAAAEVRLTGGATAADAAHRRVHGKILCRETEIGAH